MTLENSFEYLFISTIDSTIDSTIFLIIVNQVRIEIKISIKCIHFFWKFVNERNILIPAEVK